MPAKTLLWMLLVRCDRPGRVSGATGLASPGPGASGDNEETMTTQGAGGTDIIRGLVYCQEINFLQIVALYIMYH